MQEEFEKLMQLSNDELLEIVEGMTALERKTFWLWAHHRIDQLAAGLEHEQDALSRM